MAQMAAAAVPFPHAVARSRIAVKAALSVVSSSDSRARWDPELSEPSPDLSARSWISFSLVFARTLAPRSRFHLCCLAYLRIAPSVIRLVAATVTRHFFGAGSGVQ